MIIWKTIDRYIDQLIGDIRQATWNIRPPHEIWEDADSDDEIELEDISYVEEFIYGKREKISSITGIDRKLLPPPEKLNEEQAARLATELENLLNFFHFIPEFPEDYPAHLRYPFIRNIWDVKHVPLSFGESHIEFCDYEPEECPFSGYCKICEEIDTQMKEDKYPKSWDSDKDIEPPF